MLHFDRRAMATDPRVFRVGKPKGKFQAHPVPIFAKSGARFSDLITGNRWRKVPRVLHFAYRATAHSWMLR